MKHNDPLEISGMHNGAHSKVFSIAAKLRERMTEGLGTVFY